MKSKTEKLLTVLHILSWIAFIGLMIETGAILTTYIVSIVHPEAAKNLYKGLNLYGPRQFNLWHYTGLIAFMTAIAAQKAYIAYLVVRTLSKIKMANPFTMEISNMLERISYIILSTWITAVLYNAHARWLSERVTIREENFISGEFIFVAGVVFVMAQIFKKGVEIQSENELTI